MEGIGNQNAMPNSKTKSKTKAKSKEPPPPPPPQREIASLETGAAGGMPFIRVNPENAPKLIYVHNLLNGIFSYFIGNIKDTYQIQRNIDILDDFSETNFQDPNPDQPPINTQMRKTYEENKILIDRNINKSVDFEAKLIETNNDLDDIRRVVNILTDCAHSAHIDNEHSYRKRTDDENLIAACNLTPNEDGINMFSLFDVANSLSAQMRLMGYSCLSPNQIENLIVLCQGVNLNNNDDYYISSYLDKLKEPEFDRLLNHNYGTSNIVDYLKSVYSQIISTIPFGTENSPKSAKLFNGPLMQGIAPFSGIRYQRRHIGSIYPFFGEEVNRRIDYYSGLYLNFKEIMNSFYKEDLESRIERIQNKYVKDRSEYRHQLQEYNINYNKKLAVTTRFLISSMPAIKQNLCHELFPGKNYHEMNIYQMEIMTVVLYDLITDFDVVVAHIIKYNEDVNNWKEKSTGKYKTFDVYNADGSITRPPYEGNEVFFNPANPELQQHYYNKLFALLRDIETDILRKDESFIDELKREFGGVGEFLHSTKESVKTGFGNAPGYLSSALRGVQEYGSSAKGMLGSALRGVQEYGSSAKGMLGSAFQGAQNVSRSAWDIAADVVNKNVHPITTGGDPRFAYTGPRPSQPIAAAGGGMVVENSNVLAPPSAAAGGGMSNQNRNFGNLVEHNPTYVPTGWQPQQPPLQIRNSRSDNRNYNIPLGASQAHNMQVAIPSGGSKHPAVTSGLSTGRFAGFYSGPPVASLPLTAANLPTGGGSRAMDVDAGSVGSRETLESDMYGPGVPGKHRNNRGGSKTRKPKPSMSKNKKTLRRNPRKLISRRQKYSRRK